MSDRTYYQAIVYACPAEHRAAVLAVLVEHELRFEFASPEPADVLALGVKYVETEKTIGQADDIATALIAVTPDVVFKLWEDPKYEYLGDLRICRASSAARWSRCRRGAAPRTRCRQRRASPRRSTRPS